MWKDDRKQELALTARPKLPDLINATINFKTQKSVIC